MLLWSICWATLNETVTNPCVLQNNPHKALGQRSISLPTERAQAIFCIVTVKMERTRGLVRAAHRHRVATERGHDAEPSTNKCCGRLLWDQRQEWRERRKGIGES